MREKLFALSFGFVALIMVTQAQAEGQVGPQPAQCGPRAAVLAQLTDRYGENRRAMGLAANNMVMEMFASDASQSWTITVTTPQGQMCLIASGQGFEAMTDPLPAKGEPV
jgi:hypothetical protein